MKDVSNFTNILFNIWQKREIRKMRKAKWNVHRSIRLCVCTRAVMAADCDGLHKISESHDDANANTAEQKKKKNIEQVKGTLGKI